MKYKTGFVLGRFQPFHRGHRYLIEKALEQCESVVIGVGSANVQDEKNPFSFEERKKQISKALKKQNYVSKITSIIPLDDNPNDDIWLAELLKKTSKIDVVFGNNEWPNGIFEKAGFVVVRVPLYRRDIYEGTKIRAKLRQKTKQFTVRRTVPLDS